MVVSSLDPTLSRGKTVWCGASSGNCVTYTVVRKVLHNNYRSRNLNCPYHFLRTRPRNLMLFTRLFLARRHALGTRLDHGVIKKALGVQLPRTNTHTISFDQRVYLATVNHLCIPASVFQVVVSELLLNLNQLSTQSPTSIIIKRWADNHARCLSKQHSYRYPMYLIISSTELIYSSGHGNSNAPNTAALFA